MKRLSLVPAVFLLFLSCTSGKQEGAKTDVNPAGGQPATSALELNPPDATRETTFYLKSSSLDLTKAEVKWFVNDAVVKGANSLEFGSPDLKKGDSIQASVVMGGREAVSNKVAIKNTRPVIVTSKTVPSNPKANDILKTDVIGSDRDGDNVTFFYEWIRNEENAGSWDTLEGPFKRGDKISVKITPYDGEDYGLPTVLTTNIYNSAPRFSESPNANFDNLVYSCQVKATDPDGDRLTYSLKTAPPGMTVDPSAGLITWRVPSDFRGKTSFTVSVADGHGGETLQNLFLDISAK